MTVTKLLILDKDGTLVRPKSDSKWVVHPRFPEDQELMPGVAEAIQRYADDGWAIAIASNQGGVAAGHKTLEDAIAEMRYCLKLLSDAGIDTSDLPAMFCPDFKGNQLHMVLNGTASRADAYYQKHRGTFRKPNPGMILALCDWGCILPSPDTVLFVGDRPEDQQTAANAGADFMWADKWQLPKLG